MKVRDDVLVSADDMGTSGTKIYDLNYADVISRLELYFAATNGTTRNLESPIERCISKIEIVDGSEVLWSLPGDVAYSLYSQEYGQTPGENWTSQGNASPAVSIPLCFGRHLYDSDLAFQPRNFKNPQLKVTFDEATVNAAGAEGFVSDSFTLSITARLMEDAPEPSGFLMAKDLYDFTSAASGDEKVVMPTDYPWRQLMVRAYESGTWYGSSVSTYKLSCDRGKFVPFDSSAEYLIRRMQEVYPITQKAGYLHVYIEGYKEVWMAEFDSMSIHAYHAGYIAGTTTAYNSRLGIRLKLHDGTAGGARPVFLTVNGWAPHNTLFIPFGRLDEPSEWFNASQYGSVELYLTQGDADAEVNVCVQQLRTY
jgi:hypothetical protein